MKKLKAILLSYKRLAQQVVIANRNTGRLANPSLDSSALCGTGILWFCTIHFAGLVL